jgi:hypothetical protein
MSSLATILIGASNSSNQYFNGSLAYVYIYNRTFSPSEIMTYYNTVVCLNNESLCDISNLTQARFLKYNVTEKTNIGSTTPFLTKLQFGSENYSSEPPIIYPPLFTETIPNILIAYNETFSIQVNATDPQSLPLIYTVSNPRVVINQSGYLTNSSWSTADVGSWVITVTASNGIESTNMEFTLDISSYPSNRGFQYTSMALICLIFTFLMILLSYKIDAVHEPIKIFFSWMAVLSLLMLTNLAVAIAETESLSNGLIINFNMVYYSACAINLVFGAYNLIYYTKYFITYLADAAKPTWKKNDA